MGERVAIVGGGIAGLVCARLLADRYDVTLFEARVAVGGHTRTIDVARGGRIYPVDTGFIVFNDRTYPNFRRLLDGLGVASQPTPMTFGVRCDRTGIEYGATSVDALFAQRRNLMRPAFWRMLADVIRFNRVAHRVRGDRGGTATLGEYLAASRYSQAFIDLYLSPLGASIWSCAPHQLYSFPVGFLVQFFDNHGMLTVNGHPTWQVVQGGSGAYLDPLTATFRDRIRPDTPVESIRRRADSVHVTPRGGDPIQFDEVVLACHADQALAMLADPTDAEREILGAIPYQLNEALLHTDESVLPRSRRAWACWNYRIPRDSGGRATLTYNMSLLQGLDAPVTFCVTINDSGDVDPSHVIRRIQFHHPLFTTKAPAAQARHHEVLRENRTSYCGAYWGYGFHEDGVNSAIAVADAFGVDFAP